MKPDEHDKESDSPTAWKETICALATAPGAGAIAIIRLSGENSLKQCDRIFHCAGGKPSLRPSNVIVHGRVSDIAGKTIDRAILLIMRAPRTYTGENIAELQCHGGSAVVRRVLQACLDSGCRMAEPGEFTRRAFLNGRMDLVQAEAVQDLIRAETDRAASAALDQLAGGLSRRIRELADWIVRALSLLEAALDFPDDEISPVPDDAILQPLQRAKVELTRLLSGWREGQILREGIRVVIQGSPNTGKSTLFNRLLRHDRAIVSEHPGTTRDTVEESLHIGGCLVRLSDTAGLRETDCEVEKEGVRRSLQQGERADVILYVIDGARAVNPDQLAALENLDPEKSLIVLNKTDLPLHPGLSIPPGLTTIHVSAKTGAGEEELCKSILCKALHNTTAWGETAAVVSARHRAILQDASEELEATLQDLLRNDQALWVVCASRLRSTLDQIRRITGDNYHAEMLDLIFSTFCIGK